ncbi:MAG TPA: hypothetical protein VD794_10110 [Flavisolibacter sp.]|nr:hypothetical protein [Flavisolibacter sp.]
MKKQRLLSNLFILFTFSSGIASAQEKEKKKYEFFKERDFTQSYTVSGDDRLSLSNQFGKIEIKTWAKNEVKVDVHIATSSTVKEANDERFENIEIKHGKTGSTVYFTTEMDGKKKTEYKGSQSNTIDIDYVVYMPANTALTVKNKFGKTTIPDITGRTNIEQEFGELVAGRLPQNSTIEVKFSKASFESLHNADLNIQFAKDPIVIKNATGKLELDVKHSKQGVTVYADQLSDLEVDAEFSDIGVVVSKDANADFRIETDFGSLTNQSSFAIKDQDEESDKKRYGPRFAHSYKGTSGNGNLRINLDGKHSDFIISHNAPDFKKKQRKKNTTVI